MLKWAVSVLVCMLALDANCVSAQSGDSDTFLTRCHGLRSDDFSRVQDAPTQILQTKIVAQTATSPSYCEVTGYVAPAFGFVLRLPAKGWNGKLIEHGCGGSCGDIQFFLWRCDDPVRRGYACIITDGGHRSTVGDFKWAYENASAVSDYFIRASHVTAVAGKALVERYYTRAPQRSYFMGCSFGGLQALSEAQRFPWDFDGIVAVSPAHNQMNVTLNLLWNNRAFVSENGEPLFRTEDLELLHRAVVIKCDLNDGVKDGLIGDPRRCDFSPSELQCPSGKQSRDCLSSLQISAAEKIYRGPVTSTGDQITPPAALMGSERTWPLFFSGSYHKPAFYYNYMGDKVRYAYYFPLNPGPTWKSEDFNFDQDYKRNGLVGAFAPLNPDLRTFRNRGGKLIVVAGWGDALTGPLDAVDYYESTEKLMGRKVTKEFFRLFLSPGMGHCGSGDGAFAVDYLRYLEAWVENDQAPNNMVGAHIKATDEPMDVYFPYSTFLRNEAVAQFTRPIYPYPTGAKYRGRGDPMHQESFRPAE